jgi:hypothetical protein
MGPRAPFLYILRATSSRSLLSLKEGVGSQALLFTWRSWEMKWKASCRAFKSFCDYCPTHTVNSAMNTLPPQFTQQEVFNASPKFSLESLRAVLHSNNPVTHLPLPAFLPPFTHTHNTHTQHTHITHTSHHTHTTPHIHHTHTTHTYTYHTHTTHTHTTHIHTTHIHTTHTNTHTIHTDHIHTPHTYHTHHTHIHTIHTYYTYTYTTHTHHTHIPHIHTYTHHTHTHTHTYTYHTHTHASFPSLCPYCPHLCLAFHCSDFVNSISVGMSYSYVRHMNELLSEHLSRGKGNVDLF